MSPSGGDPEPRQWFDAAGRGSDHGSGRAAANGHRAGPGFSNAASTAPSAPNGRGHATPTFSGYEAGLGSHDHDSAADPARSGAYESALGHRDPTIDPAHASPPGGPSAPAPADPGSDSRWYDDDAGPLVRLYALTRGRARPRHEVFDLIALITARPDRAQYRHDPNLGPEHAAVLELSSQGARSVADLAADCDLPLGVTRVILSDLLEVGLIQVSRPAAPDRFPDERMLREVINGLRAL